jgi:hypothetical protein
MRGIENLSGGDRVTVPGHLLEQRGQRAEALRLSALLHRRVGNGVCPCCSRSFTNLKRHIRSKHPDYPA